MRLRLVIAGALACGVASAAPAAKKPVKPLAPLPMLPSVGRVRIAVQPTQIVVTEEVNLPRGDWRGESIDFYVAFGAPGVPRAIDAHLVPVADGSLEPDDDATGDALATDRAPRRPETAHGLLGRDAMAGVVVHLEKKHFERAFAPGNMASLRIRTVLDVPEDDPQGGKSFLVRLGSSRGTPLTLGRIALTGKGVTRAEARLCGPDADDHQLAIAMTPRPANAVAPVLAVRHAGDDLCFRYWN